MSCIGLQGIIWYKNGIRSHCKWRQNERNGVSNHRRLDWLLNHLFRYRAKKTSKHQSSSVAGAFPTQRASKAENHFHVMTSSWAMPPGDISHHIGIWWWKPPWGGLSQPGTQRNRLGDFQGGSDWTEYQNRTNMIYVFIPWFLIHIFYWELLMLLHSYYLYFSSIIHFVGIWNLTAYD